MKDKQFEGEKVNKEETPPLGLTPQQVEEVGVIPFKWDYTGLKELYQIIEHWAKNNPNPIIILEAYATVAIKPEKREPKGRSPFSFSESLSVNANPTRIVVPASIAETDCYYIYQYESTLERTICTAELRHDQSGGSSFLSHNSLDKAIQKVETDLAEGKGYLLIWKVKVF
jgi:hypothetical protein